MRSPQDGGAPWGRWARDQLARHAVEQVDEATPEGAERARVLLARHSIGVFVPGVIQDAWAHVTHRYNLSIRTDKANEAAVWLVGLFVLAGCRMIAFYVDPAFHLGARIRFLAADPEDTPARRQTQAIAERISRLVLQVGFERACRLVEARGGRDGRAGRLDRTGPNRSGSAGSGRPDSPACAGPIETNGRRRPRPNRNRRSSPMINPKSKRQFHQRYRRILRAFANRLALPPGSFDIRSNRGGIAVLGEVTLHADRLYLQVGGSCCTAETAPVLYRSCRGRKDYTGGPNRWMERADLEGERGIQLAREAM